MEDLEENRRGNEEEHDAERQSGNSRKRRLPPLYEGFLRSQKRGSNDWMVMLGLGEIAVKHYTRHYFDDIVLVHLLGFLFNLNKFQLLP